MTKAFEALTLEQQAFLAELATFNAESQGGKLRLSPAQRVQRRHRAQQLARRAKSLFLGLKVEVA